MIERINDARILIVSRNVWDDDSGTSSTMSNLFSLFNPDNLAHLYIESTSPNTHCCYKFCQISEISLVYKLFRWKMDACFVFDTRDTDLVTVDAEKQDRENRTMSYVRKHRRFIYSFLREVLWSANGWKSKTLKAFVKDFDPDVIWLEGSPLPLMNKLQNYVCKIAQKPASIFIQDDLYSYDSCVSLSSRLYKFMTRRTLRETMNYCDNVFVISPKMKREYDEAFNIDSTILTKGVDTSSLPNVLKDIHSPIRLVYMGQVLYGRIHTLVEVSKALREINSSGIKMTLDIYTQNDIDLTLRDAVQCGGSVRILPAVPYSEVAGIISQNDVLLFVESFIPEYRSVARLSFSTKLTDYLSSGKCIFAIGPEDIAPIEYLKEEKAAIVVTNINDILSALTGLADKGILVEYANRARECIIDNHSIYFMEKRVKSRLDSILKI